MPTPLGHALAGVAAGCLIAGASNPRNTRLPALASAWCRALTDRRVVAFGVLGMLPDVDFLFGIHSAQTHSVGATAVVALFVAVVWPRMGPRLALAAAAAYGTHVLLDWLGSDTTAPLGVMALWPFSSQFYLSDGYWFMSVCREYWELGCWRHNVVGVLREVLILGPLALGAAYGSRALRPR